LTREVCCVMGRVRSGCLVPAFLRSRVNSGLVGLTFQKIQVGRSGRFVQSGQVSRFDEVSTLFYKVTNMDFIADLL
jgi:hypothetical protein